MSSSSYSDKILDTFTHIGKLIVTDQGLRFETVFRNSRGQIRRSYFVNELGNVVYAMFVNGVLMKLGKAAGDGSWYSRKAEYCKPLHKIDSTTTKIYNWMLENNKSCIDIYVVKSPRIETTIASPVTGKKYTRLIETAGELEQQLIQEAYIYGEKLEFCIEVQK